MESPEELGLQKLPPSSYTDRRLTRITILSAIRTRAACKGSKDGSGSSQSRFEVAVAAPFEHGGFCRQLVAYML